MNESTRNAIVRRRQAGASLRQIARELGVSRETVQRVLVQVEAERSGTQPTGELPSRPARGKSQLDAYERFLKELLIRYPDITATRVFEELRGQGFSGQYTIVRERVQQLRPRPAPEPVIRFETGPGMQAQMDYSTYDIDFTAEGRRRVYLFSYVLAYSRRQYLRFVESQDLQTTVRQHIRAFEHLGGVAATCLYDNMKVVVSRLEDGEPIYNERFLAFATHYGFRPWACRPRRGQTKGKVERPFHYVQTSLLNGRTFHTLDHLNETTTSWLAHVADVRLHAQTKQRPVDRHAEELPHLIPLPATAYDISPVVYRVVNVEGLIAYQNNWYSVPWSYIGQVLPVRLTETEVILYNREVLEVARHRLLPRMPGNQRSVLRAHRPGHDTREQLARLAERFSQLGPVAEQFYNGLRDQQSHWKSQGQKLLALLATYQRADVLAALERAVRFGAYSLSAVERILAAQAQPKRLVQPFADLDETGRWPLFDTDPVSARPTSDYQPLLDDPPADASTSADEPSLSETSVHGQTCDSTDTDLPDPSA